MLKSLFSGVSGLQSHQVAMDVESNNIANVNTVGFKYSRANFSDLLAQTKAIATAPQGDLGGKNPVQVGLGSTISSMTRIFSQGSVQNSDKNTDMAIQGDGMFIISPDGGSTYKYTRSGDFKFDASGNFVDNNGFVAQGWLRNEETGKVNSTDPVIPLNIPPGLTTPAFATTELSLKANLNSGPLVKNVTPAYSVPSTAVGFSEPLGIDRTVGIDSGDIGVMFNPSGEALQMQENQGVWMSYNNAEMIAPAAVTVGATSITFDLDDELDSSLDGVAITAAAGADATETANNLATEINKQTSVTGITASVNAGVLTLVNKNNSDSASHNIKITAQSGTGFVVGESVTALKYNYKDNGPNEGNNEFTTMGQLRKLIQDDARDIVSDGISDGVSGTNGITVEVNTDGKIVVKNPTSTADDNDMTIAVTSYIDNRTASGVAENVRFSKSMSVLSANLNAGGTREAYSQSFNAAAHSSSIDVFDSLGSKHTIRMEFRKVSVTEDSSNWDLHISSENGTTFDSGVIPYENEVNGFVSFSNDGSLIDSNPPSVRFNANNGSQAGQEIKFGFGTSGSFDGLTSFDSTSSTSGISQDGYTGGDLVGIRIDQSGTLIGSFSNGRSFGLAQVAMAKFTNNEGLATEGGNVYTQTANSGEPIIGTAATSGRGFIQSSALEASNVDLSRALTQLIIVQRGFQANGKTITTSDQLLQTLIGLKQ